MPDRTPYEEKAPTSLEFYTLLQRVETKVDRCIVLIGDEGTDEHGARIGTGLTGRIMRHEIADCARFDTYDNWRNRVMGAMFAGSILVTAIWWLIQTKVKGFFK